MFSAPVLWILIGLLGLSVKSASGGVLHHYPHDTISSCSTMTTITQPTTYNISTSIPLYSTVTLNSTITVSVPETVTISIPETITPITTTYYPTVVPTASVTTVVVPTTITPSVSYSTYISTLTPSENEECPTTCSVVASTVRLFFWPTSNHYTYPSTYVSAGLYYTFTSPSVYLVINTIYGTNSLGRAGPSGTSEVFALDLDQVSTIIPREQITQQLTLNDLRTDCPQSEDPEVIATTIPDGHCDFSLLAPEPVKQWALPCNACGRLGLFDPPYAIPPLDGGIIGTTTTTTNVKTTILASTTSPSSGPTTSIVTATSTTSITQTTETGVISSTSDPTIVSSTPITNPTTVPTASASRVTGICAAAWLLVTFFVIFYL
ncbi:hypothetical protein GQX73_g4480 [Xylaria multiplex]|uniref:Uncharacterized protein n=1 Tax=Xylaria multiplex TaxID=323545 RepID=A0A7C8IPN7_9PEZI|nr:hypothetical protein GQX73_g4480 [Xylaria multiplex]